jgi:hypothetical protein
MQQHLQPLPHPPYSHLPIPTRRIQQV